MKKFLALLMVSSILFAGIHCSKSNTPGNNNNNGSDTTKPSAVGVPTGPSVSKFISAVGGSITTSDGRVEIDIPNGAIPNGDTITIQNITNSASETSNGDAYRFLPNGLKFSSPVTIKFHYTDDDISSSAPDLLGIAYQDSTNFWEAIQVTDLDTIGKTVSAQTIHFTDYAIYRGIRIIPVQGDLLQQRKIFINKSELFNIYVVNTKNIARSYPLTTDLLADPTLWYVQGNAICCGTKSIYGSVASHIAANIDGAYYTAPPIAPSDNVNPVTLYAEVHILKDNPTLKDMLSHFFNPNSSSLQLNRTINFKIKILDYNVYRFDIVDVQTVGCVTAINVYDSASIFFRVGPDNSETYTIAQDSIINLPPLASPAGGTCAICSYEWISEPIGTVNVTSASLTYSGSPASGYFVILNWVEANENDVWFSETCPNAGTTESKKPSQNFGPIEIPMSINTNESQLDTLLEGTPDKTHLRLVLIRSNMN